MSRRGLLWAALVVGLGVLAWLAFTWSPGATAPDGGDGSPADPLSSGGGTEEPPSPSPRAARLRGRIVDEAGGAIAGARVRLVPAVESLPDDAATLETESDSEGAFEFLGAFAVFERLDRASRSEARGMAKVVASARGFAEGSSQPVLVERDVQVPPLVLHAGKSLRGSVRDDKGAPIARADLFLIEAQASRLLVGAAEDLPPGILRASGRTDASGAFSMSDLAPGRYDLVASGPAFVPASECGIDLGSAEDTAAVVIQLSRGMDIRGRVIEKDGSGVPRAQVVAETRDGEPKLIRRASTEADGSFVVEGLREGPYGVRAEAKGFTSGGIRGAVEAGATGVEIRLSPAAGIEVTVRRAGKPVPNAELYVVGASGKAAYSAGPFRGSRIEDLFRGRYVVVAAAEDGVGLSEVIEITGAEAREVTVDLEPGAVVSGRARAQGQGVEDAVVTLEGTRFDLVDAAEVDEVQAAELVVVLGSLVVEARTDSSGRFALRGVPLGEVKLVAVHASAGRGEAVVRVKRSRATGVEIVLGTAARVHGVVRDVDGVPIAHGRFGLVPSGDSGVAVSFETGDDGSYDLEGVAPGVYRVRHDDPSGSYLISGAEITVPAGEDLDLDFVTGTIVVTGKVTKDGQPVPFAAVLFFDDTEQAAATADAEGRYELVLHRAGEFKVRLAGAQPVRTLVPPSPRATLNFIVPDQ